MPGKIVDACCLINVYASGRPLPILRSLGGDLFLSDVVRGEALSIRCRDVDNEGEDVGSLVPEAIDLSAAFQAGLIQECQVEGESETESFVNFAMELDDGEAASLAIAKCRGWTVATDDRKAMRVAQSHGIPTLTTPEIIKIWAEDARAKDEDIAEVLRNIQL
ncbi:MAG: hypothetical protein IID44_12365 [Planctomycetes bacterium]|nr:hypothetical protein [Planctomycetota bacterium]